MKIVEIDAGNTFIKWRLLDEGECHKRGRLQTASEFEAVLASELAEDVDKVRVASVAGAEVNARIERVLQPLSTTGVQFAKTVAQCAGVTNSYADPARMGVDRWLVQLAAYNDCKSACCIVDCGSAITVDYLSAAGKHEGGFIMPGLRLLQQSLLKNTAEIVVDKEIVDFNISPADHTSAAVSHGVNYMFTALQEKIVSECVVQNRKLYITGGDGELFYRLTAEGEFVPDLVMDGLRWSVV